MIKVLAVTPLYLPIMGGIEVIVDSVAQKLRDHGIETVVITDKAGGLAPFEVINGVPVHRFELAGAIKSGQTRAPLEILHEMGEVITRERPDVIHLHSVTQASAFYIDRLLRKMRAPPPMVATQHGVLEPVDQLGVTRAMLLRAGVLTAVSAAVLTSAQAFSGRKAASVVIANGIPGQPAVARDMPVRHRLLCVGRMQREKGFDLAIEALALVRARGVDATLDLIGYGEDQSAFAARAADLGVTGNVNFLGPRDHGQTRAAIGACSLLLVPSRTREGFSLVAAEAAMAGTPCIGSDTGGLPETIEHEKTGLIVRASDVIGLADATVNLLNDLPLWRRMSANAVKRAADRFSIDRCASDYAEIYRRVLPR